MTAEELQIENEKLNTRLQKAIQVFSEQKATIQRLTEERDEAVKKAQNANDNDNNFMEQLQEIDALNEKIKTIQESHKSQVDLYESKLKEAAAYKNDFETLQVSYNAELEEAKQLQEKLDSANASLAKSREIFVQKNAEIENLKAERDEAIQKASDIDDKTNHLVADLDVMKVRASNAEESLNELRAKYQSSQEWIQNTRQTLETILQNK